MIADITHTEGSPCPTLVLDASLLPAEGPDLMAALAEARRWLGEHGAAHILKIALIRPSDHPMSDLDYRFVQALPTAPDRFDVRGTCGHSILGAVLAAGRNGWLPRLAPGTRIRVNVPDMRAHVVCELDESDRRSAGFTVHFMPHSMTRLKDMLMIGSPSCAVAGPCGQVEVSAVSAGNPYIFVDARHLGLTAQEDLLGVRDDLFGTLQAIRHAVTVRLGWPADGAFPKIAVVGAFRPGRLAARAISVPGWHPTLALTGLASLSAAAVIPGTIPYRLARQAGCPPGELTVDTPGSTETATAAVSGDLGDERLSWVSVARQRARHRGRIFVEPLRKFAVAEEDPCLSLLR